MLHDATIGYEPFGARDVTTHDPNPIFPWLGFTGRYHDPTGLLHLRARDYDPTLGRFTTQDPLAPPPDDPYVATPTSTPTTAPSERRH